MGVCLIFIMYVCMFDISGVEKFMANSCDANGLFK